MNQHLLATRLTLVALAALCFYLGISQNHHQLVLQKAIRICLECIGIG